MNRKSQSLLMVTIALIVLLLAGCGPSAPTEAPLPPTVTPSPPTMTSVPPTTISTLAPTATVAIVGPSPRGELQLAYDPKTDQVLLFGGATGNPEDITKMSLETWIYAISSNTWTQVKSADSPTRRDNSGLAYDAESDRIILFGGASPSQTMWDTWSFDMHSREWTKMKPGPSNLMGSSMVYDSKADRMLVFGGFDFDKWQALNGLWSYDYNTNTWTELTPATSPPGRNFQSMVYDSKADRTIMWGGAGETVTDLDTSVWVYDYNKNTWEERKTDGSPSGRFFHGMVYVPSVDRTILYGGSTHEPGPASKVSDNSSETWAYDYNLNTWTLLEPATDPGPLSFPGMVYVPSIDRVLLFGGRLDLENMSDKSWLYDFNSNTWTQVTPNS